MKTNKLLPIAASRALTLLMLPAALLVFLPSTLAAPGENCTVNIADSMPVGTKWNETYIIKGEDGSAWQRAILAVPDVMTIGEEIPALIKGTARKDSDVQVFLFLPEYDADGNLKKPSAANCYDAGKANAEERFELAVHPTMVWGTLGQELIVDAFYRMEQSWDQMKAQSTNQNFFIGTHIPMREIVLTTVPEGEEEGGRELCESHNRFIRYKMAVELDPAEFREDLKGDNFLAVEEKVVGVGTLSGQAVHTFYGGLQGGNGEIEVEEIATVSLKAAAMEAFKRALMANPNVGGTQPGIKPVTAANLREAADGNGVASSLNQDYARAVRNVMIGTTQQRDTAIDDFIVFFEDYIGGKAPVEYNVYDLMLNDRFFEELFPADVSTEATWAEDFIEMLEFWTTTTDQNDDLIVDDQYFYKNYNEPDPGQNFLAPGESCEEYPQLVYLHGVSPRILIHSDAEVVLQPDFDDLRITHAERGFDVADGWLLPAGPKSALYYEYQPLQPVASNAVAEYCVTRESLSGLVTKLTEEMELLPLEADTLLSELAGKTRHFDGFIRLSLQNPDDIAKRFAWQANGEELNILQLFFRAEGDTCDAIDLTGISSIVPDPERDGFEAGLL